MKIDNLDQVNKVLAKYVPIVGKITGKDITLQRMRPLMDLLGNPQDNLKIIHIAGTSGKTSTSYYIAALLKEAGQKTGLSVSPHIVNVCERAQINLKTDEQLFCSEFGDFIDIIENSQIKPSYFELLVAFAFWFFKRQKVDYAVMETGLGGLYDATNIAQMPGKICVITDIGIDHTKILGKTVREIAAQKAGIIHKGNIAFMNTQPTEIVEIFKNRCNDVGANLMVEDYESEDDELPAYQARNWALAKSVYDYLADKDGLGALSSRKQRSSRSITVPGRMDTTYIGEQAITLDGAHNEQKIKALVDSYDQKNKYSETVIVLSFKDDKYYKPALPLLRRISGDIIATEFPSAQDLPAKPVKASELANSARRAGFNHVAVELEPRKALELAKGTGKDVIVTGSLYLVSEIKKYL